MQDIRKLKCVKCKKNPAYLKMDGKPLCVDCLGALWEKKAQNTDLKVEEPKKLTPEERIASLEEKYEKVVKIIQGLKDELDKVAKPPVSKPDKSVLADFTIGPKAPLGRDKNPSIMRKEEAEELHEEPDANDPNELCQWGDMMARNPQCFRKAVRSFRSYHLCQIHYDDAINIDIAIARETF